MVLVHNIGHRYAKNIRSHPGNSGMVGHTEVLRK